MMNRVFPRFVLALFVSIVAFILLGTMQFAGTGGFTRDIGGMSVNVRYSGGESAAITDSARPGWLRLDGGASVSFGGLEFRLDNASGENGGFAIVDLQNERHQLFPDYVSMSDNEVVFSLPSGSEVSFLSWDDSGSAVPELRISANFPQGIAAIEIPFIERRSSFEWDSIKGIFGVNYGGNRFMFSRQSRELINRKIVLSAGRPAIFYHTVPDLIINDPADFVIPETENSEIFSAGLAAWVDRSFETWGISAQGEITDDTLIAFFAEVLRRGVYGAATVPSAFGQSRTWESAFFEFTGRGSTWQTGGAKQLALREREKSTRINALLSRRDYGGLFTESRPFEFLVIRGTSDMLVSAVQNADSSFTPSIDASAGILESYADFAGRNPSAENPFTTLAEQAVQAVAGGLRTIGLPQNMDGVLVFSNKGEADIAANFRLGRALRQWGEQAGNEDWASAGRSILFSVISLDEGGFVPAVISFDNVGRTNASSDKLSSASLFRILDENEFIPRAKATGVNGITVWTAARQASISQTTNYMDISVNFPAGQTHYVAVLGVRPFALLQMHSQNVERNAAFERTQDTSGWEYFADDETLILKIRHRADLERIRVLFTAPVVTPIPTPDSTQPSVTPTEDGSPAGPVRSRPPVWTPPVSNSNDD